MIQHVTLEVRREDARAEARFWELLGFARVAPPAAIAPRSLWLEQSGIQIHLAYVPAPLIPAAGHVAVVADDYEASVGALLGAGHPVDPRTEHWGAARAYTRTPAGHVVEVMAAPPPSA